VGEGGPHPGEVEPAQVERQLLHVCPRVFPNRCTLRVSLLPGVGPGGQRVEVPVLHEGEELLHRCHVE
jgi:hypothetical protein